MVSYPLMPKHSVGMALDDCHDAYRWLRQRGYEPEQLVLAGDYAGGYLALALAQRLQAEGEKPAALVAISPIYERYLKYLTGCAELFRAGFTDVNQFTLQRTALS